MWNTKNVKRLQKMGLQGQSTEQMLILVSHLLYLPLTQAWCSITVQLFKKNVNSWNKFNRNLSDLKKLPSSTKESSKQWLKHITKAGDGFIVFINYFDSICKSFYLSVTSCPLQEEGHNILANLKYFLCFLGHKCGCAIFINAGQYIGQEKARDVQTKVQTQNNRINKLRTMLFTLYLSN